MQNNGSNEVKLFLVGPEGCGKTTFAHQLRSMYETRELIWPISRVRKIQPTGGQDSYDINLRGGRIIKRGITKEWARTQVGISRDNERLLRRWQNTAMKAHDADSEEDNSKCDEFVGQSVSPIKQTQRLAPQPDDAFMTLHGVEDDAVIVANDKVESVPTATAQQEAATGTATSVQLCMCEGGIAELPVMTEFKPSSLGATTTVAATISMPAIISLRRSVENNDQNNTNSRVFSLVDSNVDSADFVTAPTALEEGVDVALTRKDLMKAKEGTQPNNAENDEPKIYGKNTIRKLFPHEDETFSQFSIDVNEIGGKMLSLLPKFISKANLIGADPENPNASSPPALLIFMIDLSNSMQIPTAAMEFSFIRQNFLQQNKTSRRRWCIVANKAMSLLTAGAPPIDQGKAELGSILTQGNIDSANLVQVQKRVRQLLLLPDHPDFSSDDESDEEAHVVSYDGKWQRATVSEDFVPPIFVVDTWTGTGLGDVVMWLEDR